jgi:hypothetical protein
MKTLPHIGPSWVNERDVSTIPSRSQLLFEKLEEHFTVPLVQLLADVIETILRGKGKDGLGGCTHFQNRLKSTNDSQAESRIESPRESQSFVVGDDNRDVILGFFEGLSPELDAQFPLRGLVYPEVGKQTFENSRAKAFVSGILSSILNICQLD